ncbi:hypothetical protein ACFL5V_09820 [Fibrobacterota bacterium]
MINRHAFSGLSRRDIVSLLMTGQRQDVIAGSGILKPVWPTNAWYRVRDCDLVYEEIKDEIEDETREKKIPCLQYDRDNI